MILILCLILALIWGGIFAVLLQFTGWGRFLAARRAWLAVVIGFGVDLLILLVLLDLTVWLSVCAVIVASSLGMIVRSLANEWRDHQELVEAMHGQGDTARQ
jgi:hypothetical protein